MSAKYRALGVAFVCVLLAGVTACGGAASRFANHMERGERYFAAGDFLKASIEFRNAVQIEPRNSEARVMAGRAAEMLGRLPEAAGLYQSVIDSAPENSQASVTARARLARLLLVAGGPERALKVVEDGLAKHPDDPELLTVRGGARFALKNESGAVADADQAVRLAPTNEDAVGLRAGLYREAGDLKAATKLVSATLEQLPRSTALREMLISLDLGTGDQVSAEQELRKLIALKPQELRYRYDLANLVAQTDGRDAAQRVLEDAVKQLPQNSDAKLALINFVATQRSRDEGESTLRGFIEQDPDNLDLRLGLGSLLQGTGALQAAIATYDDIVRRNGTDFRSLIARDRIAAIEASLGHHAEARRAIEQVLAANPRDNDALLMRARLELDEGALQQAVADLRAVLRERPDSVPIRRMLAQAYRANGDFALAEDTLRSALELEPTDAALRDNLADLLLQMGRTDQAVEFTEETVARNPADPNARVALVRAKLARRDFAGAQQAVDALVKLRPDAAAGPFLSGLIAQELGHRGEAEVDFKRALTLEPNAMDAMDALAWLQVADGRASEAITRVKAVVDANPRNGVARNLLGRLYSESRAYPQAIAELSEATRFLPTWNTAYRNLALAKLGAGDVKGAVAACEAGLKQVPHDPSLSMSLASLYEREHRIDDAIAQYQSLHAHNPRMEVVANNLAFLLVTYRSDRQSLEQAEKLTQTFASSDNSAFLDTYGWVRLKAGDVGTARTSLERAVARSPGSAAIRYHLAMAQLKAGERDKARSNLETALSGAATFDGVNEARSVLASLGGRSG